MEDITIVGIISIIVAGITMAIGSIAPALAEGRTVARALQSIAQQPDESDILSRVTFVGLAMIESIAIYCFVISIILIFVNPFWDHFASAGG